VLHLRQEVDELGHRDRGAADKLLMELSNERAEARRALEEILESRRYLTLLETLEEAVREPRWAGAELPIEGLARKEFRKLEKSVAALGRNPSDELLHKARIRAKRARYAAELAAPVVGKPARRFVERARKFQDVSGEHQDAVVTEQKLLGFLESGDPGVVFVAGRLAERQAKRRSKARRKIPPAWKRLERAGRKAWN
jgi:CHAD domain-containing protein